MLAMPGPENNSPTDQIYRSLVKALPDTCRTVDVVESIAMLLSAILIEQGRDKEKRIKATRAICDKIVEAVEVFPERNPTRRGTNANHR